MSMRNSGRVRLAGIAALTCAFDRIGVGEPVTVMTMSDSSSDCGSVSHGATRAADFVGELLRVRERAAGDRRPTPTPCALRCIAVSLPISPAPIDQHPAARQIAEDFFRAG